MRVKPFDPAYGSGTKITVGITATSAIMNATSSLSNTVLLTCVGPQPIWVRVTPDTSTDVARVDQDLIVLPNMQATISKTAEWNRISAIAAATGSILYAMEGDGV